MVAVTVFHFPFAISIALVSVAAVNALRAVRAYFNKKEDKIWKPIGKVTELTIYPFKYGQGNSLEKVYCTKSGLTTMECGDLRDGCIVIYEKRSKRLFTEENLYFENIIIEHKSDRLILKSSDSEPMALFFYRDLDTTFTIVTVHPGEVIPVRDCGDSAAKWVSQILRNEENELRLGYYAMEYHKNKSLKKSFKNFVENMSNFTRNGVILHPDFTSPLLINSDSIDGVSSTMKTSISPDNFNPNILFRTSEGPPLQEYKWKKIKIGNVEFECIKPCDRCFASRKDLVKSSDYEDIPKFMKVLKAGLQKYADFKMRDSPYVGINLKLCGKKGVIKVNDEVYVLC